MDSQPKSCYTGYTFYQIHFLENLLTELPYIPMYYFFLKSELSETNQVIIKHGSMTYTQQQNRPNKQSFINHTQKNRKRSKKLLSYRSQPYLALHRILLTFIWDNPGIKILLWLSSQNLLYRRLDHLCLPILSILDWLSI